MTSASERRRSWRLRGVGVSIGLAIGVMCVFSALDRRSMLDPTSPSSSRMISGPGLALSRATIALYNNDFVAASAFGADVVGMDPMFPAPFGIWGMAQLQSGNEQQASRIFRVASNLGWRDRLTQLYWLAASLAADDPTAAAQRLDAILRSDGKFTNVPGLDVMENSPRGQAALADRAALNPPWINGYVASLATLTPGALGNRLNVLVMARRKHLAISRQVASPVINYFFTHGREGEIRKLSTMLGLSDDNMVTPARDFRAVDAPSTSNPFGWKIAREAGIETVVENVPNSSDTMLVVKSSGSYSQPVARHALLLPPGTHMLRWRTTPSKGRPLLSVDVICSRTGGSVDKGAPLQANGASEMSFTIPPLDRCRGQWIVISTMASTETNREGGIFGVEVR